MVNVVIPTANRPQMLRQALQSVSAQTARDRISTVLVSENGGNPESRQICAEFPELPICYVFRDPATSASAHGRIIVSEGFSGKYTAILFDDDWWMPEHLANGLQALQKHPAAVACYSSFYEVSDEAGIMASGTFHFYWWFGANFPRLDSHWELTLPEMAAASFLNTAGHYSSLIAYSPILQQAYETIFELDNDYDTDRMLMLALATQGSVLYEPLATVFVRRHAMQDSSKIKREAALRFLTQTTNWIVEKCKTREIDLISVVAERIINCPAEARPQLITFLNNPWCVPLGHKIVIRFPETAALVPDTWRSNSAGKAKDFVRQLMPPFVIRIGKAIGKCQFSSRPL